MVATFIFSVLVPLPPSIETSLPSIDDRVVAGARGDDIGAAAAIDGVVAGAGRDHVDAGRAGDGQRGGERGAVEVLEIGDADDVADRLVRVRRDREIHRRDAAGGRQHQRVGASAAVDRGFGAMVGDAVIAGAGGDDIGAAIAVDRCRCRCCR